MRACTVSAKAWETGEWQRVLEIVASGTLDAAPDAEFWDLVFRKVAWHGDAGNEQRLEALLQEMYRLGAQPSTVCLGTTMNAFQAAGNAKAAIRHYDEFVRKGGVPDGYCVSMALTVCKGAGLFRVAQRILEQAPADIELSDRAFNITLATASRDGGGHWRAALDILRRMRKNGGPDHPLVRGEDAAAAAAGGP